ncbi:MAG: cellulase family glycosylhydrolase [Candidatus Marinimicrobia bacterium]|nr:cellulase family glycosylhydrolase [Candidatus Neomarinimicrobiota bacterium]
MQQGLIPTNRIACLLLWVVMLFPQNLWAEGFVHASGPDIVDGDGKKVLMRGMGLGGWLVPEGYMLQFTSIYGSPSNIRSRIVDLIGVTGADKFYKAYMENYVTREDIMLIKEWGFDHIRLPFHYNQFSPEPGVWNDTGFKIVDSLLAWCEAADMLLVLDMHCAPGGQNPNDISDSDGNEARFWLEESNKDHAIEIWRQIATRYVNEERIAGYDLLNEPATTVGGYQIRLVYIDMVNAIREVDPNHAVFIEGNWYATDFDRLTPPFDTNMVYSFHKYWSVNSQASIQEHVQRRSSFDVPLWMSESGENSNNWYHEAVRLFEENEIGWCWWTHKKFETITSPLSATMPDIMSLVLEYWEAEKNRPGSGAKPTQALAEAALMSMAEALKTENCIRRPGVIPALFDIDYDTKSKPLSTQIVPGTVLAANYDIGGQGVAYHDNVFQTEHWDNYTAWNTGYQYRNDGVDIQYESQGGQPNVGWIDSGEWLKYTVLFSQDGVFEIALEISGPSSPGDITLEVDGIEMDPFSASSTTIGSGWEYVSLQDQIIYAGEHELKIYFNRGGINFRTLKITENEKATRDLFPKSFTLGQNYPNPFNTMTHIPVEINRSKDLKLTIMDILGRELHQFELSGSLAGETRIEWDGLTDRDLPLPAGVYYYRLKNLEEVQTGKMLYLP